jgi:tripartite-type tricarboxylate transporter receptor subunit TctC
MLIRKLVVVAVAGATLGLSMAAHAQGDARRPIRIIVPFAPGGPVDLGGRVIAPKMEERLKQPVIVENRPGGGAAIGAQAVSNAPADAQTLFLQTVAVMTPVMIKDFSIDVLKDFEPVAPVWNVSYFMFINSSLPVKNLNDFVAHARANAGKLNYAAGTVSTMLMMETVKARYGLSVVGIQYKGSAPSAVALAANEVQANFDVAGVLKPHVDSGKVRVLFTTARKRSAIYPDAPTAEELGVPDMQFALTGGLWAKAGAPRPVVDAIGKAVSETMALPDVVARFATIGWEVNTGTRDELVRSVRSEMDFLAKGAKTANYKPE